jgi:RNA polymerase sigma factor (sigma-70 family)
MTMTDDQIIRACAWRVRRYASPGLDRDDVLQEGRIAMWQARQAGRVPADAVHAERYLLRRVRGAMIDAHRAEWRQRPPSVSTLDDGEEQVGGVSPQQPDAAAQARQALARVIERGSSRMLECLAGLIGADAAEVARELGIDASRVSQLRQQARRIAAPCW